ncbi:LamG domain-containing protein [Streptomyces sp. NPDC048663]|uniref:LamG domain-containing protein n=1 Tax=Streptomyces sp. NPDC048663 TaxID=3155638 RepID=UPI003437C629
MFANPDGTFTQETSAAPVRAQLDDGSWVPIDTTLRADSDGTIRAAATATRVSFSGGGDRRLVTVAKDGKSLDITWPSTLPKPELAGSSATYPDVLEGVDLKVTAVSTGFRQVLIVKDASAAANPDLEHLEMSVTGHGVHLQPGLDGGVAAVDDNGTKVFESPSGQMWDSTGDATSSDSVASFRKTTRRTAMATSGPAVASTPASDGGSEDPSHGPTGGDKTADVDVTLAAGKLTLAPDLGLLRGKDTAFPVYIDPPVKGVVHNDWTALSSDGDHFWEWDGDKGTGYCANYAGYLCSSTPYTQRLYYEYPLTSLYGKKVLDVTFEAYQTWTFTCDRHSYDLSLVDKGISSSTRWSSRPTAIDLMGDQLVSHGRGSLCSPSQPADWVRFSDNVSGETNENLTTTVAAHVDGEKPQITFSLTPHDETSTGAWARFRDDAKLSVTYISKPAVPTPVGVQQGNAGSVCNASSEPFATSSTKPKMYATVQSADGANAQLRGQFEVWKADGSAKVWSADSPSSEWVADNAKRDAASSTALAAQTDYRMHARTQAYYKTDRGITGTLTSAWSSWCYFRIDTERPPAPVISSSKYKPADTDPAAGGVGESGTFTFTPADEDPETAGVQSDVTSYQWKLNSGKISDPIRVSKGAPLSRTIAPDQAGENTLQVLGYDDAGNSSLTGYYSFNVKGAELPSGIWHLDNSGSDSTTATAHTLTTGGAATYSALARAGSHTLNLDGTSGYAATSQTVLDTGKSFSVSAWVRLKDASRNYTALSQAGTTASGFQLYYSSAYKAWIFNRHGSDIAGPVITRSISAMPPTLNVWTHLTGVYDAAAGSIQLYVNGRPQGEPVSFTTPWNATGALQVGRLHASAAYSEYFAGQIDEVHVWSRALADSEVIQDAALEDEDATDGTAGSPLMALLGSWNATTAATSPIADESGYGRSMALNGATLAIDPDNPGDPDLGLPSRQVMALNGTSNYASVAGPLTDDTGSFTATAWVRLDSHKLADTSKSYQVQVVGQSGTTQSSWGVWYEQPAGSTQGKWYFGRPNNDATGATWTKAQSEVAQTGTWVRLTLVYDAQQASGDATDTATHGALFLYVDTTQVDGDHGVPFTTPWQGGGQIEVGRARIDGAATRYFPGHVASVRVWAGAMNASQIGDMYADEQ